MITNLSLSVVCGPDVESCKVDHQASCSHSTAAAEAAAATLLTRCRRWLCWLGNHGSRHWHQQVRPLHGSTTVYCTACTAQCVQQSVYCRVCTAFAAGAA